MKSTRTSCNGRAAGHSGADRRPTDRLHLGDLRRWHRVLLTDDLVRSEELSNLLCRGFRPVGTMDRIFADRAPQRLANGARRGLSGVGRTHDVTVLGNRILPLQHLDDYWTGRHEFNEFGEKRPLP